jgi:predicted glutamine amidotransferase
VLRRCIESECSQQVVLLATTPLTDEAWAPLGTERLHVFAAGEEVPA